MQNADGVPIGYLDGTVSFRVHTPWSNKSDANPPGGDTKTPGGDNHEVCCSAAQFAGFWQCL